MTGKRNRKKWLYLMGIIGFGCLLSFANASRTEVQAAEVTVEAEVSEKADIVSDAAIETETDAENKSDTKTEEADTEQEIKQEEQKKLILKTPVLTLTPDKDGIKLTWKTIKHAKEYEIYRKETSSDKVELIKTTKKTSYIDKNAKYGVTYTYKVRAIAISNCKKIKSQCSPYKRERSYHIDPSKPMVALTYDDGPSQYTEGILNVLKKYQSRATFFEVGYRAHWYPKTTKRLLKEGSELGNHSYNHHLLGNASKDKIQQEISSTDKKIKSVSGITPVLFRPPYGDVGSNLKKYADKPLILWSIDTLDWESRDATAVYNKVMSQVSDGDIILMHDVYNSTKRATERIVPALIKKGYQLVTVSELAEYKGKELKNGGRYAQM